LQRFLTTVVAGVVAVLVLALQTPAGLAVEPDEMLSDAQLEARAREISKELRCVVCQNQSIDDSGADLARDLRLLVRERLVAGDSNEQVIQFIVDRYGDFVLLRPPFKPATYLLWAAPFLALLVGAIFVTFYVRRRRQAPGEVPLSTEERARVDALLKTDTET
jgi:cytochrome c-type biogenesis protein CcmH